MHFLNEQTNYDIFVHKYKNFEKMLKNDDTIMKIG